MKGGLEGNEEWSWKGGVVGIKDCLMKGYRKFCSILNQDTCITAEYFLNKEMCMELS